jgi:ABC-2 type transport system ATP-binding protein
VTQTLLHLAADQQMRERRTEARQARVARDVHSRKGAQPRQLGTKEGESVGPEDDAIVVESLRKSYGEVSVLDGLWFRVARGTVFALLGPNGAGKTTTVRILATLLDVDHGRAVVAGYDVRRQRHEARRRLSLTGQYVALDDLQSGEENLRMVGRLAGLRRHEAKQEASKLLHRFGLEDAARRRVRTYSGGMRRRLDLAASLVSRPQVILDEPTTGLDPSSRLELWTIVEELVASGVTILLTTQYLEEADRLADRIAVLGGGRIVAEGSAAELKALVGKDRLELTLRSETGFERMLGSLDGQVLQADAASLSISLRFEGAAAEVRALLDELDPERDVISEFGFKKATLDDVFMTLTGPRSETETHHV